MEVTRRRLLSSPALAAALPAAAIVTPKSAYGAPALYVLPSPGDVTIFTSAELIELDFEVGADTSIEACVGELTWRIGCALSHPKVRNQLANTKSRYFALTSITLNRSRESLIAHFLNALDRQIEAVTRKFGLLAPDALPINVATAISEDQVVSAWHSIICSATEIGFRRPNVDEFDLYCVAKVPSMQNDKQSPALISDYVVADAHALIFDVKYSSGNFGFAIAATRTQC